MTVQTTMRYTAIAIAAALAMGACTAPGDEQTTTPVTTATSAASTTPTTASTQTSTAASPSTSTTPSSPTVDQALLAEAIKVSEAQFKLEQQYFKEGGWPRGLNNPTELTDLMMDEGLTRTVEGLNQVYEGKVKWQSGEGVISDMHVVDVPQHKGSLIATQSCRDARAVKNVIGDDQTASHGILVLNTSYYKRDSDGKLKISYYTAKRVESCGS